MRSEVWKSGWLGPLVLTVAIFVTYAGALRVYFLSDDYVLLTEAQLRHTAGEIFAISPTWFFYRPFGKLFWWSEYRLFGLHGAFYHLTSIALHTANSLLVIVLARRYLAQRLAVVAGICFAVLPLQTEAVVWLADQYDLLATCGYLAAIICLAQAWERRRVGWYLLALAAFQLSLWSKETSFTLPFTLVVLALVERKRPSLRLLICGLIPFGLLLGLNLFQRFLTWGSFGGYPGVQADLATLPSRLGQTALTLLAPLNRLVFPAWLLQFWQIITGGLVLVGTVFARQRRPLVAGMLWLGVCLIPAFGLLPVGADLQNARVLYLPSVGGCLWLAAAIGGFRSIRLQDAIIVCLCVVFVAATSWQIWPWQIAGENSIHIVQELHRFIPRFPPASRVEIVDPPDNYQGAYIYRLGLNHSFGHHFQSTFALETIPHLQPLRYPVGGFNTQVQFGFDPNNQRWNVVALRYISSDVAPVAHVQHWDFAACPADWTTNTVCLPELGVRADPDVTLESNQLGLRQTGWYEAVVVVETQAQPVAGTLHLRWRAGQADWVTTDASSFNLSPKPGTLAYHVFLAPIKGGQPLQQVGIELMDASGAVVKQAWLRFVP